MAQETKKAKSKMSKSSKKTSKGCDILSASCFARKNYQREIIKFAETKDLTLSMREITTMTGFCAFTILTFMVDFAQYANDNSKNGNHAAADFFKRHNIPQNDNTKQQAILSQSIMFDIFMDLSVSRETIRRVLIALSDFGLITREAKGPPFPDRLAIAKPGRKLMKAVAKRTEKNLMADKAFAYL